MEAVADPETLEGGARNMKYKPPHMVTIFFWPIFYRPGGGAMALFLAYFLQARGGGMAPLAPPPWIRYWEADHSFCEVRTFPNHLHTQTPNLKYTQHSHSHLYPKYDPMYNHIISA